MHSKAFGLLFHSVARGGKRKRREYMFGREREREREMNEA
jgi:hypothetical protein